MDLVDLTIVEKLPDESVDSPSVGPVDEEDRDEVANHGVRVVEGRHEAEPDHLSRVLED